MPYRRLLAVLCACVALAGIARAAVPHLTAERVRIGSHPGLVRVVVDFAGGTLDARSVTAIDPSPYDGAAALSVVRPGIRTHARPRSAAGVRVRVVQGAGRLRIELRAARGRLKYLGYLVAGHDRLAIDLWRSAPPPPAGEILVGRGRCLTLERVSASPGRIAAAGRERGLFEHQFAVLVRDRAGRVLGRRHVTAARGRWSASVAFHHVARQLGTLEAAAASAKDGSLACLVQERVRIPATP
jgi:Immunoglobulin-like domain of bacterial spore germination